MSDENENLAGCPDFEIEVSALVDGELDAVETPRVLDHLLACASCASFYRSARKLNRLVRPRLAELETGSPADALPLPKGGWDRIAQAIRREKKGDGKAATLHPLYRSRTLLALAALLVLSAGLWSLRSSLPGGAGRSEGGEEVVPGSLEVTLGERAGKADGMTDRRFLEIATELIAADRRYQREMLRVMNAVSDMEKRAEGRADDDPPATEAPSNPGADGEFSYRGRVPARRGQHRS